MHSQGPSPSSTDTCLKARSAPSSSNGRKDIAISSRGGCFPIRSRISNPGCRRPLPAAGAGAGSGALDHDAALRVFALARGLDAADLGERVVHDLTFVGVHWVEPFGASGSV